MRSAKPLSTPGEAPEEPFVPEVTAEVVPPTPDTDGQPVKTTRALRGTVEEQMAALMARQNESENALRELQARNRQLESQLHKKVSMPVAVDLPSLKEAIAHASKATTAEGRRPVLTTEGYYVHPHAFENAAIDNKAQG